MPVQINETGEIKTIGSSPNIFVALLGDDNLTNRMDWNSTKITAGPNKPYDYVLPFEPSKVNILGLATTGTTLLSCTISQGQTVSLSVGQGSWMTYGSSGPTMIRLSSNILRFATSDNKTFTIKALLIATA